MDKLRAHLRAIVDQAFRYQPPHGALIVADSQCSLAATLGDAYRDCLPTADFVPYEVTTPAAIRSRIDALHPGDLVVLVESTRFELDAFRLRVELFRRGLKVIEHLHLARMAGPDAELYIDSLAYDPEYLHGTGYALKALLDGAQGAKLHTGDPTSPWVLHIGPMEKAMHNIGDYTDRPNVGGQFPIGEIFTEALDLASVHGEVALFAFGNERFEVQSALEPIVLGVEAGRVVEARGACPDFAGILAAIRAWEGEVWIRELGFGLNRAFSKERRVTDIGTYERMCGVHLSLGAKHPIFPKPQFSRRQTRFHVDVFADTVEFRIDGTTAYAQGQWRVTSVPDSSTGLPGEASPERVPATPGL